MWLRETDADPGQVSADADIAARLGTALATRSPRRSLRILVHDFAGHPFQIDLSRALARRGHIVQHVYCGSYTSGKGRFDPGEALACRDGHHRQVVVVARSEEHTSELQSLRHLVCRLLLEKTKTLSVTQRWASRKVYEKVEPTTVYT